VQNRTKLSALSNCTPEPGNSAPTAAKPARGFVIFCTARETGSVDTHRVMNGRVRARTHIHKHIPPANPFSRSLPTFLSVLFVSFE